MSKALRFGLLGAATGFMQGMHTNWVTERAQAAEEAKEARLNAIRQGERADDRAFQREQAVFQTGQQRETMKFGHDLGADDRAADREMRESQIELQRQGLSLQGAGLGLQRENADFNRQMQQARFGQELSSAELQRMERENPMVVVRTPDGGQRVIRYKDAEAANLEPIALANQAGSIHSTDTRAAGQGGGIPGLGGQTSSWLDQFTNP